MTELRLRLHGDSFSLRGPGEALAGLALLYHPSVIERGGGAGEEPTARFRLGRGDGGWRLLEEGDAEPLGTFDAPWLALLRLEHELERRLLGRHDSTLALHAGAVVVAGSACLLAGAADSGKSSCTLQLVELGHPFLAEEIAAIDTRGRVLPHLQTLAIDPRVSAEIERERRLEHGRLERVDAFLHRYLPERVASDPAPLGTIVLPSYLPGRPPKADEPSLESVLTELLGYCFEPPGDPEPAIDRLLELTAGARIVRLRYPDAAGARRMLSELFGRERG